MDIQIEIEGRKIPVAAAIAASDDLLRRAFTSLFSWAVDARIDRTQEAEGLVKMIKAGGTKGNNLPTPLRKLKKRTEKKNPLVALYEAMGGNLPSAAGAQEFETRIMLAVEAGDAQVQQMQEARKRLLSSVPRPLPMIPYGF